MKFDPLKKFGTVHGHCNEYPGARFSQNGFLFNASHKCLNPKEDGYDGKQELVGKATETLLQKKNRELADMMTSIESAQKTIEDEPTAPNKSKLTKLTTKYNALVEEISELEG